MCLCFGFGPVSASVMSLVCYSNVRACSVFEPLISLPHRNKVSVECFVCYQVLVICVLFQVYLIYGFGNACDNTIWSCLDPCCVSWTCILALTVAKLACYFFSFVWLRWTKPIMILLSFWDCIQSNIEFIEIVVFLGKALFIWNPTKWLSLQVFARLGCCIFWLFFLLRTTTNQPSPFISWSFIHELMMFQKYFNHISR